MQKYTLKRTGDFYKGNLHSHTTISDGRYSPEELIKLYKRYNYSFLAFTDHRIYGIHEEFNTPDFLVFPGVELDTSVGLKEGACHHIVGISTPEETGFSHGQEFSEGKLDCSKMSAEEIIDLLSSHNNLAIYAHPYWSKVDIADIVDLKGLVGMEIMNYGCEMEWKCGNSEVFFDQFWWNDNKIWCFATDDGHDDPYCYCGGYIVVKTDDFSHRGIIDAISEGSFYAAFSQKGQEAPHIIDFIVEDGVAKLSCSPSRNIYIYTPKGYRAYHAEDGKSLTYAEYKLPDEALYVKAICVDFAGNTSWCQPIAL